MDNDPDKRLALFREGVRLLGGSREAARLLGMKDRSLLRLINGTAELHDGFIADIITVLIAHRDQCENCVVDLLGLIAGTAIEVRD